MRGLWVGDEQKNALIAEALEPRIALCMGDKEQFEKMLAGPGLRSLTMNNSKSSSNT